MKILYFEARKGILRRYVMAALALFLCLNTLKIYTDYRAGEIREVAANTAGMQIAYAKLYDRVKGQMTSDTVGFIVSEEERLSALMADGTYSREWQDDTYSGYYFGDYFLIHKYFYAPMSYCVHYPKTMNTTLEQVQDNLTLYEASGNRQNAVESRYILDHYTGRTISEFYCYDAWEKLLAYDFSDLLILLLLVLGIAPIFTREKENGMTLILYSSKRGKWPLILSKCGTAMLFAFLLTALFALANVLTFGGLCGFEGSQSPLYAIEAYQNTPFPVTISTFFLLCVFAKAIGFGVMALLLALLSACCQKALIPCLIGLVLSVILSFISGWAASAVWWKESLSALSPLTLTQGWELMTGLYGRTVCGTYLLRIQIVFIVQIVLAGMLIPAIGRKSCFGLN